MTLTVNCEGRSHNDLTLALREVLRHIEGGYLGGADSNKDGRYNFKITGEEEAPEVEQEEN